MGLGKHLPVAIGKYGADERSRPGIFVGRLACLLYCEKHQFNETFSIHNVGESKSSEV